MEPSTGSRSSQEDPCGHEEIELQMSVTISRAWADAFKSPGSGHCEDVLKKIVSEATKKNHNVRIIDSEGTSILDGCFCGIKEIRTALQAEIRKKQSREKSGKPSSGEDGVQLETDQQSHQEDHKMGSKDLSDIKPKAPMNNSTLEKVEREQSEAGNRSTDQSRNNEKLEFQQRNPDGESKLKSGAEDSNSENSNNAKIEKKRQRTLLENSTEVKTIQMEVANSAYSEDRDKLQMEGKSKYVKSSEHFKQQVRYPDLATVKNDEYSESQINFTGKNQEVKFFKNDNKYATSSHSSERNYDLEKKGTSKDGRYSENPKQQEVNVIKNENNGVTSSHNSERRDDLRKEGISKDVKNADKAKQQGGLRAQDLGLLTSKNNDYKGNRNYDATYPESANSSGRQENQATDLEHDRICALMLLPSVDIDEDIFSFLNRHRSHELSHIFNKCNLHEKFKDGQGHKLAFEAKRHYDTDSVIADFRGLYDQTTITRVSIPEGVDLESLKSLVEAMAEFKGVELRFPSQERVCKIVGSDSEMNRAKETLLDVIYPDRPTSHGFDTRANKKASLNVQFATTHTQKEPTRNAQLYTVTAAININQASTSVFTVLNQSHDSLLLSVSNLLTIEIKHGELTKMSNVDVVVSCINHQLDVDGQLADQIMRAAGYNVTMELLSQKQRQPFLHTGCLVHTSAGYLKGVKAIIHVVRPQVVEFPHNDQRSTDAFRKVFTNCISYTNDVLRLKSICLPPFGFLLYGAEMVVDSFLDAVQMFAATVVNSNPSAAAQQQHDHLNYIQLVTNEQYCIGQLIERVKQRIGAQ